MSSSTQAVTPAYLAETRVGTLKTVVWVSAALPAFFMALRLYVRISLRKAHGLDDAIALIATILLIAYASVCTAAANKGLGRHIEYVAATNPKDLIDVALLSDIGETLAIMACALGKTSFAVTLQRIVIQPWVRYLLWFVIITMNLVNILAAIFVFAQCKDPRHLWNQEIPSECWPDHVFTNFSLFVGAYSGAQDFVLALLPWAVILQLQMKTREKIAIAFAMSLGIFAGATAIVKTTYLVNLSKKTDFTWALPPLLWWAAAEDGLAIVASTIPILRPLLKKLIPGSTLRKSEPDDSYRMQNFGKNADVDYLRPKEGTTWTVVQTDGPKDRIHDDESDKSILEQHAGRQREEYRRWGNSRSGIAATTNVSVTYGRS